MHRCQGPGEKLTGDGQQRGAAADLRKDLARTERGERGAAKRGDLEISGWKCREHAGEMKGTWWLIMKIHGDQWWLPPVNVYKDVENAEILQIISELETIGFPRLC